MGIVRMNERGSVVLPKSIRRHLQLSGGQAFLASVTEDEAIRLRPARAKRLLRDFAVVFRRVEPFRSLEDEEEAAEEQAVAEPRARRPDGREPDGLPGRQRGAVHPLRQARQSADLFRVGQAALSGNIAGRCRELPGRLSGRRANKPPSPDTAGGPARSGQKPNWRHTYGPADLTRRSKSL